MSQPMNAAERRAYNQRQHAAQRQAQAAGSPRGVAELWWDEARKLARERAAAGDDTAWSDLALTLTNYCKRYSG